MIHNTEIQDRITTLIESLDTNMSAFAKEIGVSVSIVRSICKGRRSKPSFDVVKKILDTYPNLNPRWLIQGTGEMYDETNRITANELQTQINELIETLSDLSQSHTKPE